MLYMNIKSFVDPVSLQKRKTTAELLAAPKETFLDILKLYVKLAWILKSEWIKDVNTPDVKLDSKWNKIQIDFEIRDFNYLILSKWNNILNDLILKDTIIKCFIMLELYIESKLIKKNPQYEYFAQFTLANYEWVEYVFHSKAYNKEILFTYIDSDDTKIEIKDNKEFNHFNKDLILLIEEQLDTTDAIKAMMLQLRNLNFNKYKSIVLNAVMLLHKWEHLEEDGEFMMILKKEILVK